MKKREAEEKDVSISVEDEEYVKYRSYADELHGKEEHTGIVFIILVVFLLLAAFLVKFFI